MKRRFYLAAAAVVAAISLGLYLVNKRGEIVKRYVGEPDLTELHRLIERLLAQA